LYKYNWYLLGHIALLWWAVLIPQIYEQAFLMDKISGVNDDPLNVACGFQNKQLKWMACASMMLVCYFQTQHLGMSKMYMELGIDSAFAMEKSKRLKYRELWRLWTEVVLPFLYLCAMGIALSLLTVCSSDVAIGVRCSLRWRIWYSSRRGLCSLRRKVTVLIVVLVVI
jgi:hypothetical protein